MTPSQQSKKRGYKNWLLKVDEWAESHSISRSQALSVLVLDNAKNGAKENTIVDLMSYANFPDFAEEAIRCF